MKETGSGVAESRLQIRNPEGLYETMRRRAESYDIRQAKAKKRRKFGCDALKLDDVQKDENGDERENAALGDGGRGAKAIIEQVSIRTDNVKSIDAKDASWQEAFDKVIKSLPEKELEILNALKQDFTDRGAAKLVGGISHMKVHRFKAKLRGLLLPAYKAWKKRGMLQD